MKQRCPLGSGVGAKSAHGARRAGEHHRARAGPQLFGDDIERVVGDAACLERSEQMGANALGIR